MADIIDILGVVHIVTAILMAWPFYALVAVNQRVRLGPPLGDRVDTYMENIIKNRTIPCFMFQATALITGLALVLLRGLGLEALIRLLALGLKFSCCSCLLPGSCRTSTSVCSHRLTLCSPRPAARFRPMSRLASAPYACAANAWHPSVCLWY